MDMIFALAVVHDLAGEADGFGNWRITVGPDPITQDLMLDRFDNFIRQLAKVSPVCMLRASALK
jgi:hypothetical protein